MTYYYPATIRGIVTSVLAFFNDLHVQRTDDTGALTKDLVVPIKFGPVDKAFQYRTEKEFGSKYYLSYPNATFALTSIAFDAERATGVGEHRYFYDEKIGLDNLDDFWSDVQPVPYDLTFQMQILTESMDDWCQIMENILPRFAPAVYLRVKEFSFLDVERDLQMNLGSISNDFLMEQGEEDRRTVNGTLEFTVKAVLYNPVKNAKIIKQIQSRYNLFNDTASQQINQYNTSAMFDTSAFPPTSSFSYSGNLEYPQITSAGTLTNATWFTSASSQN